jgi:hypothetical protein
MKYLHGLHLIPAVVLLHLRWKVVEPQLCQTRRHPENLSSRQNLCSIQTVWPINHYDHSIERGDSHEHDGVLTSVTGLNADVTTFVCSGQTVWATNYYDPTVERGDSRAWCQGTPRKVTHTNECKDGGSFVPTKIDL